MPNLQSIPGIADTGHVLVAAKAAERVTIVTDLCDSAGLAESIRREEEHQKEYLERLRRRKKRGNNDYWG